MRLYSTHLYRGEALRPREGDMSESQGESEFRVTDRRRRVEEPEPQSPSGAGDPEGPRSSATAEAPGAIPVEPTPASAAPPGSGESRQADQGERGLEGLFVMLASSAAVALGQAADPMTGTPRDKDPGAAAD